MTVTRDEFLRYERVRRGGRWNMITHSTQAMSDARLGREKYMEIITHYKTLRDKYLIKDTPNDP